MDKQDGQDLDKHGCLVSFILYILYIHVNFFVGYVTTETVAV